MTSPSERYQVRAEPNGGTSRGGHMRGYAWGPPLVDEITMDSLDRYRVALNGRSEVLLVQPQQTTVWVVPNAKTPDRGVESIDGDGTWMFPETLPDVTIGKPMNLLLSFAPYEDASMWHTTGPVVLVKTALDGLPVDQMTTVAGAVWLVETAGGPIYEFDFCQPFPRHRRFTNAQAAAMDRAHDRYAQHYSLHDIETLRIGHPVSIEALRLDDETPYDPAPASAPAAAAAAPASVAAPVTVSAITNLFDTTPSTPEPPAKGHRP